MENEYSEIDLSIKPVKSKSKSKVKCLINIPDNAS